MAGRRDESEERDRIARTVAAIKAVTGTRPVGWHTRSPGSVNTRRLLVEEGGFLYVFQPTRPPVRWSNVDMRRANRYGGS